MHTEALDENSRNNLLILKKGNLLNDFYLAGGTAVALHLGHRISYDLDFFSHKSFDGLALGRMLSALGDYRNKFMDGNNLIGGFNGTSISFIFYKPEMIGKYHQFEGINITAIDDLIGMKIEAISSRGKKRDFIDLFSMMKYKNISITDAMFLYREKYKNFNPSIIHALKSLMYFSDAENDPLPEMKTPIQWQEVKNFFERELSKMDTILKIVDTNSGPHKIGIKDNSRDFGPER